MPGAMLFVCQTYKMNEIFPNVAASVSYFHFLRPFRFNWSRIFNYIFIFFLPFLINTHMYKYQTILKQRCICIYRHSIQKYLWTVLTRKYDYKWWNHKLSTLWLDPRRVNSKKHNMARVIIKGVFSKGRLPEFTSQLFCLQAGWPRVSNWIFVPQVP